MEDKKFIDISIIIPVYNAEVYLRKSLESLVNQTKKNIEFICVNDGSTDGSEAILQEFANRDSRFQIFNKKNEGVSLARNYGLEQAHGYYIMFLDADDWYEDNTCERAYQLITENEADLAFFCMNMEYTNHSEYRAILAGGAKKFDKYECQTLWRKCIGLIGDECNEIQKLDYLSLLYLKIYKRDIIENNHIRFVDIRKTGSLEDGVFNIDYLKYVKTAVYTDEMLYHYNRYNPNSITTRYRKKLLEQWCYLFSILGDRISDCNGTEFKKALNNRMAYAMLTLGLNIMCGPETKNVKYKKFKHIFQMKNFYREFEWKEICKMPKAFGVYFALVKCKLKSLAFLLLCMMQFVRNKNKGLK